jgi:glutathione S-transferase
MATTTRIVGSYLSPYVRKVLVCLDLKGVPYEIDPIVPFCGNDAFSRISPVRRIPVLMDDLVTLADSSVICSYLDERYPERPLLAAGTADRGRARWFEEYAGSRMGEVFIGHYYNQLVIRRFVWGEAPDEAVLQRARAEEIPAVLDYLESHIPAGGLLFNDVSIADVAIASMFRNAAFARFAVDAERWPRTADFAARMLALPAFERLAPFEQVSLTIPIADHRTALQQAGAPVSVDTFETDQPRRGVLTT